MSDEQPLNPAERELEAALGALHPAQIPIDRDRMMFEAGRCSAHPRRRPIVWQTLSGALAAALLVSVSLHRQPRDVERVVYVPASATATTSQQSPSTLAAQPWDLTAPPTLEPTPPASSYLILRRNALNEDQARQISREHRLTPTRGGTQTRSGTDLPTDAGFFGRAGTIAPERL